MGVKVCVAPDAYRPGRPKRKSLARGVGERFTFWGLSQQLACQATVTRPFRFAYGRAADECVRRHTKQKGG